MYLHSITVSRLQSESLNFKEITKIAASDSERDTRFSLRELSKNPCSNEDSGRTNPP